MERYPQHRVISIVKCPVAGYVVQPFVIDVRKTVVLARCVAWVRSTECARSSQASGVQASVEEQVTDFDQESFDLHDDLLSDMALPMVEPSCTLRSTQKSSADNDDEDEEEEEGMASQQSSQNDVFDLVSDSNDEEDDEYKTSIGDLLEDR